MDTLCSPLFFINSNLWNISWEASECTKQKKNNIIAGISLIRHLFCCCHTFLLLLINKTKNVFPYQFGKKWWAHFQRQFIWTYFSTFDSYQNISSKQFGKSNYEVRKCVFLTIIVSFSWSTYWTWAINNFVAIPDQIVCIANFALSKQMRYDKENKITNN